jgi:hypothetical protein
MKGQVRWLSFAAIGGVFTRLGEDLLEGSICQVSDTRNTIATPTP